MPRGILTDHPRSANALVRLALNNLIADVQALATGDLLLSAPALAIGTVSAAKVKHAELVYQINGMRYRIAAGEVAFTATTHDIADPDADPKEAIYVLSAGVAGTVTITKGDDAEEDEAEAPDTPEGEIKLGEVKLQHDGSAIFDATTSLLSAAHITDTYTSEVPFALAGVEVSV